MVGQDINDTKRTIFVGGFPPEITERTLHASFLPFGEITHIQIPKHPLTEKHKGYGFLEFEEPTDAAEAIENMDRSEMLGRVIKVNLARPVKFSDLNRPIWAQSDDYVVELKKTREEEMAKQKKKHDDFMKQLEEEAKID